jgi:hypothetical protein
VARSLPLVFDLSTCSPVHENPGRIDVKIDDYFVAIERGLSQNPQISNIEKPITILTSDDYNGLIRCRVHFWDGSLLDLYEVISTELGYPVRIIYAYTYIRKDQRIFRYDNAPHHPEIATHPHHKHIGPKDKLAPADQPNLNQVLAEIETYLEKTSE